MTDTRDDPLAALAAAEPARLHPLLTNEEVEQARERGRARAAEEARKAAMKVIEDEAKALARHEAGMVTGETVKDELVSITLDLAEHSSCITINGMRYWHGYTYQVQRHVADTLREIMARGWAHQDEIDGKNLDEHYKRARATVLSPAGAINAPSLAA